MFNCHFSKWWPDLVHLPFHFIVSGHSEQLKNRQTFLAIYCRSMIKFSFDWNQKLFCCLLVGLNADTFWFWLKFAFGNIQLSTKSWHTFLHAYGVEHADTKMKWRRCKLKESWPNLWHYTGIYLEGLCKAMNKPKDNTCTSQALNPLPSGYKLGMITASANLLSLTSCDFLDILQ
jgi:hypothetical protein